MKYYAPAIACLVFAIALCLIGISETQWTVAEKYGTAALLFGAVGFLALPIGFR